MQRFNNAEEVFAYYSSINGDFKVVEEGFNALKKENEEQKEIIGSLGKQLVIEKITRAKNEESLSVLGKQLVEIKLGLKGDK